MDEPTILLDVADDGVCTLTLNRPDQLNAFNVPMMREMIEPTIVLDDFVERFIRPQQQFNLKAVGTILRLPTDDPRVIRCVYSIVAQVLFYKHCHEVVSRLAPVDSSTPEGRAMLADHIANFTLAALDGLAQKGLA